MQTSSDTVGTPDGAQLAGSDQRPSAAAAQVLVHNDAGVNAPVRVLVAAAAYGPTSGPPLPFGAAPAGSTESVAVSAMARARLSRPLPVWAAVPAASAVRARRETMTPLVADGSAARSRPAAAATIADEAEVPVTLVVPLPMAVVTMSVPGAARKVSAPKFDDALSASFWSVFETPMTPRSPAG